MSIQYEVRDHLLGWIEGSSLEPVSVSSLWLVAGVSTVHVTIVPGPCPGRKCPKYQRETPRELNCTPPSISHLRRGLRVGNGGEEDIRVRRNGSSFSRNRWGWKWGWDRRCPFTTSCFRYFRLVPITKTSFINDLPRMSDHNFYTTIITVEGIWDVFFLSLFIL